MKAQPAVWIKRLLFSLFLSLIVAPLVVYVIGFFVREPYVVLLLRAQPRFNVLVREKETRPDLAMKMLRINRASIRAYLADLIDVTSSSREFRALVERFDKEHFLNRDLEVATRSVRLATAYFAALSDSTLEHYVIDRTGGAKDLLRRELRAAQAYLDPLVSGGDILALRERIVQVGVGELPENLKLDVRKLVDEFNDVLSAFERARTRGERAQVVFQIRGMRKPHGALLDSCDHLLRSASERLLEIERELLAALDPWTPILPEWVMKYF